MNGLEEKYPLIKKMSKGEEITWINPRLSDYKTSLNDSPLSLADVNDAEDRLLRFAPFIKASFPETENTNGLIESPLKEIAKMKNAINEEETEIQGKLMLKMDSNLAVAGSVKARGGIYEILKYAEDLAIANNKITYEDDYIKFADKEMKQFFSEYSIHVGSTGNLGLSIGIISAALGFNVNVHMSADAKQWKKDLLRSKGVNVIEYHGDYGKAVEEGRRLAEQEEKSYFVDDENSQNLFLGYAVAARRLKSQLKMQNILVDEQHPLFVYIPCGVGGAPGGITFGLKQEFRDNVYVVFEEPTQACCMALGLMTGLHNKICVQDIGLSGLTEADGLAVGRASKFVGKVINKMIAADVTVTDDKLYHYMKVLMDSENIFIEPSSCAAFEGVKRIFSDKEGITFLKDNKLNNVIKNSTHIIWATGGSLVPQNMRLEYLKKANSI